jgi:hypothetical protein
MLSSAPVAPLLLVADDVLFSVECHQYAATWDDAVRTYLAPWSGKVLNHMHLCLAGTELAL